MRGKKLNVSLVTLTVVEGADIAKVIAQKRSAHLNLMVAAVHGAGPEGITGDVLCSLVAEALKGEQFTNAQRKMFAKYTPARHVGWVMKKFAPVISSVVAAPAPVEAAPVAAEVAAE